MSRHQRDNRRRGSATVAATLAVIVLLGMTGAMLSVSVAASKERNAAGAQVRAFAAANSGLAHTIANMASGIGPTAAAVGTSATLASPEGGVHFSESYYLR